jgi:hypothetical protein
MTSNGYKPRRQLDRPHNPSRCRQQRRRGGASPTVPATAPTSSPAKTRLPGMMRLFTQLRARLLPAGQQLADADQPLALAAAMRSPRALRNPLHPPEHDPEGAHPTVEERQLVRTQPDHPLPRPVRAPRSTEAQERHLLRPEGHRHGHSRTLPTSASSKRARPSTGPTGRGRRSHPATWQVSRPGPVAHAAQTPSTRTSSCSSASATR